MKVVAVLQARMGSTRLPGKALKEINGLPILVHIWRRLLACREVDECVVAWGGEMTEASATTLLRHGVRWQTTESPDYDLLSRIIEAGVANRADAILRVRADCLFLDPEVLDIIVGQYRGDYPWSRAMSNWPHRTHSEGLDAEVWSMELLWNLSKNETVPREDFGTWAIENDLVTVGAQNPKNEGLPHLSIDTQEDFDRAMAMLKILGNNEWRYTETLKAWEATR